MKKEFWELVRAGKKCITIRKSAPFRVGDVVPVQAGGYVVGKVRITGIKKKTLAEIGEEEAKKEGIPLRKLLDMLKEMYGSGPLYVIEFEPVEFYDPPLDPEELAYGGMGIKTIAEEGLRRKLFRNAREMRILEMLAQGRSIREVAKALGGLGKRKEIRRLLRRIKKTLSENVRDM